MKRLGIRRVAGAIAGMLLLAACGPSSTPAVSHALAVTAGSPHPLTFYEGSDDIEPITPFYATLGPNGTVLALGFVPNEGAYYLNFYNATTWEDQGIANGFQPSDPLWECDESYSNEIAISADGSLLARSCQDGSLTIYALPTSVMAYHAVVSASTTVLTARTPVVAFAPAGGLAAITDDGPGGAGQHIMLLSTSTWQTQTTIAVSAGLLSQPSWSPDGSRLAAVDLNGVVHVWSASSGNEIASASVPHFAAGTAATDPPGPAPQWSPDGSHLYVTAPAANNSTVIAAFTLDASGRLRLGASATIAFLPDKADPQLSPDGSLLFVHTGLTHGQIFTTPDLRQVGDFPLAGTIAIWGSDSHTIDVFTLQATVISMQVG
jgi:WD40 repeat protein